MRPIKKNLRILVIEDSEDDTILVIRQIERGDYNVYYERVETAESMIKALNEKKWDIILSDYAMPYFNGLEALTLLKRTGLDIPFIIISGVIGEEIAVIAMKAGAQDYIIKNNLKRLLPAVERELREASNRSKKKLLEEKQKEVAVLKNSELKFRNLVSDIHVGVMLMDSKGEIVLVNNKTSEILGLTENQIMGKQAKHSDWKMIYEDGSAFSGFMTCFQQVVTTNQSIRNVMAEIFKPEQTDSVWVMIDVVPRYDNERILQQVVWTFVDRTERKRAIDALRESEQRYRRLIEMSPDAIAIHQDGKIVFINASGASQMGAQDPQEMIGKSILDIVHPDYHKEVKQREKKTLKGEDAYYTEEKFIKLDGTVFDVEVTTIPSYHNNKPATQVIVRDITKRKKAEAEIIIKNEELIKLNHEKDRFFSIIAHDLRSPFSSFLGITELLADKMLNYPKEKLKEVFVEMRDSANNLYKLLENLLQWAGIQQGLFPFRPEKVKLCKIVNDSISVLYDAARNKEIEIVCNIPDDLIVYIDTNMFQTVIRNLISNAVKFTPKGGQIKINAGIINKKNVEISVSDTGIGMDESMINKIFNLNAKVNRPGTDGEPSTGLGLLLCKEFIEKHGGEIRVESGINKGTTFYINI